MQVFFNGFCDSEVVHHGIDTQGEVWRGGLLRLKWIDKGLDVRYMRYCYMAYTEVRSQRSEVGLQTLELRFMFMTKRRD